MNKFITGFLSAIILAASAYGATTGVNSVHDSIWNAGFHKGIDNGMEIGRECYNQMLVDRSNPKLRITEQAHLNNFVDCTGQ